MNIYAYESVGYTGRLVLVEVDIRRGIPGLDIVGLPDSALKESRDRVRVALRRCGFEFPIERILVNLSPAGLRKEGASYDLALAVGILVTSGQLDTGGLAMDRLLCVGELQLDGVLRSVRGVLPAAAAAKDEGIEHLVVPDVNLDEAMAIPGCKAAGIHSLNELAGVFGSSWPEGTGRRKGGGVGAGFGPDFSGARVQDMADFRGQGVFKRALEIAAAGAHHLLVFGPPGSGKTMGARVLAGILPDLDSRQSLEVTRIWSQAKGLPEGSSLLMRPPFREPHHTASAEGLVGGGSDARPGEVSLAHHGVLFLDEAPEFGVKALQSLRQPLESGRIDVARAGKSWWYPADFQLVLAMNPCPCGNLGREEAFCQCLPRDIGKHWRRLGSALLDRVDIRVPLAPVDAGSLFEEPGEASAVVRERIRVAQDIQKYRFRKVPWFRNSGMPSGSIHSCVSLDSQSTQYYTRAVRQLGLSSRASCSVLRVARTIADMAGREGIIADDVLEALQHRRYGDRDLFWLAV